MKTNARLWWYLAQFFLEREMFPIKCLEKIHKPLMFNKYFPKIVPFIGECGNNERAGQAADDIRGGRRIACWITRDTDTNTFRICNIIAFPLQHCLHERALVLRYTYVAFLSHFGCVDHDSAARSVQHRKKNWWLLEVNGLDILKPASHFV